MPACTRNRCNFETIPNRQTRGAKKEKEIRIKAKATELIETCMRLYRFTKEMMRNKIHRHMSHGLHLYDAYFRLNAGLSASIAIPDADFVYTLKKWISKIERPRAMSADIADWQYSIIMSKVSDQHLMLRFPHFADWCHQWWCIDKKNELYSIFSSQFRRQHRDQTYLPNK